MELEREHVHKVYSQIAAHFSDTRFKPWPRIAQFLQEQPLGSLIADVGCGNGKYLGVNSQVYMLGSDICPELTAIGRNRGHEVLTCDCLNLPYRADLFDGVISIAVIHHLSTESRRLKSLQEMVRILHPGGVMLVYVWAMEQEKKKFESQDVMVPWHLQPKYTTAPGGHRAAAGKEGGRDNRRARMHVKKQEKRRRKDKRKWESSFSEDQTAGTAGSGKEHTVLLGDLGELNLEEEDLGWSTRNKSDTRCHEDVYSGESPDVEHEESLCSRIELDVEHEGTCLCSSNGRTDKQPEAEEEQENKPALLGRLGYTTYQRFYHVFKEGELAALLGQVTGLTVREQFYDHENWCIVAVKDKTNKAFDA